MAKRAWMIGAAGVAIIALAWATSASDETAADPATTTPAPTATASESTTAVPTTTQPPAPQTSTTSSTSTTTSTAPATTTSTTQLPSDRPFNGDAFDAVISAETIGLGDISAGVAVMRNGNVLHTAAFGMEDPFQSIPATVDTQFRIASVSKMFTAVAIMQLVNEGSIQLDEPFAAQLGLEGPFNDPRVASVTVRQLMSHMSGFAVSRNIFFARGVETWRQAANDALGQVLESDPGTAFRYSNTNYCLLGMLLEEATGQKFENAIRERVLTPLDLSAHMAPTFDARAGDALHASSPGRNYMETLGPAGAWVSTPLDIAKLASSLRPDTPGTHLLEQATVDSMRVPVPVPVEDPPPEIGWSYGLGLLLYADGSWGHTGTIESTHAMVVNRPDGLTVAVLISGKFPSNTDDLLPLIDLAVAAASS